MSIFLLLSFLILTMPIGVIAYALRLARSLRYELTADSLVIHGGFKPITISYQSMTDVQTIDHPSGRPWRSFGMSMPGLFWGSFSWKSVGSNLRLYAARLKPLTVISTQNAVYGITPADADTFVSELKQRFPSSSNNHSPNDDPDGT